MGAGGSIAKDVADAETKEEKLQVMLAHVRPFMETSGEAIVLTEGETGVIIHANAAWEALCGYAACEVVGKTNQILQGPDTDCEASQRLTSSLQAGLVETQATLFNYRKDGTGFWNYLTVQRIDFPGCDGLWLHAGFLNEIEQGDADDPRRPPPRSEALQREMAEEAWENLSSRRRQRQCVSSA